MTATEECEGAIEVTTSHPNAVSPAIERNERSYHNIELVCIDRFTGYRLPKAKVIERQLRLGQCFVESHFSVRRGNWQENALFCAPCALDDCACIYFIPHREITADRVANKEVTAVKELIADAA